MRRYKEIREYDKDENLIYLEKLMVRRDWSAYNLSNYGLGFIAFDVSPQEIGQLFDQVGENRIFITLLDKGYEVSNGKIAIKKKYS